MFPPPDYSSAPNANSPRGIPSAFSIRLKARQVGRVRSCPCTSRNFWVLYLNRTREFSAISFFLKRKNSRRVVQLSFFEERQLREGNLLKNRVDKLSLRRSVCREIGFIFFVFLWCRRWVRACQTTCLRRALCLVRREDIYIFSILSPLCAAAVSSCDRFEHSSYSNSVITHWLQASVSCSL